MKRFFAICVAITIAMMLTVHGAANASVSFWMDPGDLDNMTMVSSSPAGGTVNPGGWQSAPSGRVAYKYFGGLPNDENWGAVQIGYQWEPPGAAGATSMNGHAFPDLSAYDDFRLSIHNQHADPIKANIWINTGYTDFDETPTFAQVHPENGGWQEFAQSNWDDLVLDFSDADVWQDGENTRGGVPYLDHVTGIGFAVAYDGPIQGYAYSVDVDTTPEPASLAIWGLLGACCVGLGWWRRRRRVV